MRHRLQTWVRLALIVVGIGLLSAVPDTVAAEEACDYICVVCKNFCIAEWAECVQNGGSSWFCSGVYDGCLAGCEA